MWPLVALALLLLKSALIGKTLLDLIRSVRCLIVVGATTFRRWRFSASRGRPRSSPPVLAASGSSPRGFGELTGGLP